MSEGQEITIKLSSLKTMWPRRINKEMNRGEWVP